MYSKKLMTLFRNPKNMGRIKNADGVGKVGNKICGDIMHLYIKVRNNKIVDAKYETFGCVAAIGTSEVVTKMIKGKTVEQAEKLAKDDIAKAVGGLPPLKLHCSVLVIDALKAAINNFKKR